ncbi:MAG: hypothetical protein ACREGG_03255 [Candidatus Saccharimonadales bacterium]
MATIAITPSLNELNRFIFSIRAYPVSVRQILQRAQEKQAPKEVQQFYQAFDQDRVFKDRDDLAAATEQVEILREESQDMPQEEFVVPEED